MKRRDAWLALFVGLFPIAAAAQEDPAMETQRCVWACLHNSPGAGSAQYNQCVADRCSDEFDTAVASDPILPEWRSGPTADGQGMYAAIMDDAAVHRLSWLCAKGRGAMLAIEPVTTAGDLVFMVDGREMAVSAQVEGSAAYVSIAPDAPLFAHIVSGQGLLVLDASRQVIGSFSMLGAAQAIGQAGQGCR